MNELRIKQQAMVAEVYSRAYAAAISCNDPGILPEAEAKKAVVGFVRLMKNMEPAHWGWYNEDQF